MNANFDFSIIVPTYQEAKNIPSLVARIASVNFPQQFEVILMDDNSHDATSIVVAMLQKKYPWLRMIVNEGPRDLSRAIINGIKAAAYPIVITLDADLSHPPEKIPELLSALSESGVEIAIGSRYVPGGSVDPQWPQIRIWISKLSALLARPLARAKDPLSGFIAMRKEDCFRGAKLAPVGWKIGLEIMVKNKIRHIREVPIHFSERTQGYSKLNFRQGYYYFKHLMKLYFQVMLEKCLN